MRHVQLTYSDGSVGRKFQEGTRYYDAIKVMSGYCVRVPRHKIEPGDLISVDADDPDDPMLEQMVAVKAVEVFNC